MSAWCQWVGREQSVQDMLLPFPTRALTAALDRAEELAAGRSVAARAPLAVFFGDPAGVGHRSGWAPKTRWISTACASYAAHVGRRPHRCVCTRSCWANRLREKRSSVPSKQKLARPANSCS